MLRILVAGAAALLLALAACAAPEVTPVAESLTVTSTAFTDGGPIPARHTCDAEDLSPPLAWSGAPVGLAPGYSADALRNAWLT